MTGVGAAINTAKVVPGSTVACPAVAGWASPPSRAPGWPVRPRSWRSTWSTTSLEDAKRFGATHGVKPDDLAALQAELTGGDGFTMLEAIGIPLTMRFVLDATRRGGTTCVIGAGGFQHEVTFNGFELFYSEKTFVGSYYGSADVRSDFNRILRLWKAGRLDLEGMITRKIGLEDVNDAIAALKAGEVIRQVITFDK